MRIKKRFSKLAQNKLMLLGYILLCVLIVAAGTIIPIQLWATSSIESRGITSVRGDSMIPNINNNDVLYVQPVQFERGEIVVAKSPRSDNYSHMTGTALLKRIVGLPGEIVEITDEGVLIDGELLDEPYTDTQNKTKQDMNVYTEIILSDNEYYLLGDNRENSFDSRHVGAVHSSSFLYGLTVEPNETTHKIWNKMIVFGICDIVAMILVMFILLFVLTKEKKRTEKAKREKRNCEKKNGPDNSKTSIAMSDQPVKSGKPQQKSRKNQKKVERALKAEKARETQEYIRTHKKKH